VDSFDGLSNMYCSSGGQILSLECLAELMVHRGCAVGMVFLHGGEKSSLCLRGFGARNSLKSCNCPRKNEY